MRKTEHTTAFKKDWKRELRGIHGKKLQALLDAILSFLEQDVPLAIAASDHPLSGDWVGFRDCHLRPDLVLIYRKVGADRLQLVRLGSHSELYG